MYGKISFFRLNSNTKGVVMYPNLAYEQSSEDSKSTYQYTYFRKPQFLNSCFINKLLHYISLIITIFHMVQSLVWHAAVLVQFHDPRHKKELVLQANFMCFFLNPCKIIVVYKLIMVDLKLNIFHLIQAHDQITWLNTTF